MVLCESINLEYLSIYKSFHLSIYIPVHLSIYLYGVYAIYLSFCQPPTLFILMQGAPFSQICKMTDVFEGSIIRCIRRLEEVLRQMCQAAKTIGNTELENKFAGGTLPLQIPSTSNYHHSSFCLSTVHSFICCLFIQPSIQPSIHPLSIHSSIHSAIHPFFHPLSIHSIIHSASHPSIHPSIHPLSIHSSIYPSNNPSIHLSIPSLSYRYSKN